MAYEVKFQQGGNAAWIKTTKAQKIAWMLCEEGSFEDNGRPRHHAYEEIRGSYTASMYVYEKNLDVLVRSLTTCTLQEQSPKVFAGFAAAFIEICNHLDRPDLANEIEAAR